MVAVNRNATTQGAVTLVVAIVDSVKLVAQPVKVRRSDGIEALIQFVTYIY